MKIKKFVITCFVLLFISIVVNAEKEDDYSIDDEDQSSAWISTILTDEESIEAIGNAAKATKGAVKGIKEVKNAVNTKKEGGSIIGGLKDSMKEKLQGLYFRYKPERMSGLERLRRFGEKVSEVLNKADKKINQWRTTLPAMKAFAKNTKNLADETVEVFKDFEFNDLYDIDRKWSRRLDATALANYRNVKNFGAYMNNRYHEVITENKIKEKNGFSSKMNVFVSNENEMNQMIKNAKYAPNSDEMELYFRSYMSITKYDESDSSISKEQQFLLLPKSVLLRCAQILESNELLLNKSYGIGTSGMSVQNQKLENINELLNTTDQSYSEISVVNNLIQQERAEVKIQTMEIEQLTAQTTRDYARILMRKKEREAMSQMEFKMEIDKLAWNDKGQTYEENRQELFEEYLK